MIYWQLQWHKNSQRIIASFYIMIGIMLLMLSLPMYLTLITLVIHYIAFRETCKLIAVKPLAIAYQRDFWLAIYSDHILQLRLAKITNLSHLVVLKFQNINNENQHLHYWLFAVDIKTKDLCQAGTWRQLLAILNIAKSNENTNSTLLK